MFFITNDIKIKEKFNKKWTWISEYLQLVSYSEVNMEEELCFFISCVDKMNIYMSVRPFVPKEATDYMIKILILSLFLIICNIF